MALRHDEYTSAGAVVAAIDVDSPAQHAAMVEKLNLSFPMLSDPDRTGAIIPFGLPNPTDERNLAVTATVVIDADGEEMWRHTSRDYADRPAEDEALDVVRKLGLDPVEQPLPTPGDPEPGPTAMPYRDLRPYFRGAKFAVKAVGSRIPASGDEVALFGTLMDRYMEDVTTMFRIMRAQRESESH